MRLHCSFNRAVNAEGVTTEDDKKDEDYIQGLSIPSQWMPPEAPSNYKLTFAAFDELATTERRSLPWTRRCNLTPSQRHILSELLKRQDLIVLPTDKNLGPCFIERQLYIAQVLKEHLL
jgi:hypothetical protein